MLKIDTHQHFWNLERVAYPWLNSSYGPIYRTFEASELIPQLKAAGIDKTVIVQSMNSYADTDYMLETAAANDWVAGVVGWVPLYNSVEAGRKLEEYTQNPLFKGVRHLIHEENDPDWIIQDCVIEGLKLLASYELTFDIVAVFPNHLKHVPMLAEKVPNLKLIINHLAKPPIKSNEWDPWASQLARASEYPNVFAKVSGLNTAANWNNWSSADLRPYINFALEKFGAERLMFGSDWPVANLAGDYQKVWTEINKAIGDYSEAEKEAIFGNTAVSVYNLKV